MGCETSRANYARKGTLTALGYNVQSVILIGPLSVIKATTDTDSNKTLLSPFNVSDAVPSPTFTREEVSSLFAEFACIQVVVVIVVWSPPPPTPLPTTFDITEHTKSGF